MTVAKVMPVPPKNTLFDLDSTVWALHNISKTETQVELLFRRSGDLFAARRFDRPSKS